MINQLRYIEDILPARLRLARSAGIKGGRIVKRSLAVVNNPAARYALIVGKMEAGPAAKRGAGRQPASDECWKHPN